MRLLFISLVVTLFSTSCIMASEIDIDAVRKLYITAGTNEIANDKMLSVLSSIDASDALLLGYKASATMMKAKFDFSPVAKLSHFKKGKRMLEQAIKLDPLNIELRVLRYLAQSNAPSFLNYSDNIDSDKHFISGRISYLSDRKAEEFILKLLNEMNFFKSDKNNASRRFDPKKKIHF